MKLRDLERHLLDNGARLVVWRARPRVRTAQLVDDTIAGDES